MRLFVLLFSLFFILSSGSAHPAGKKKKNGEFSFAFFTDIHLNNGNNHCFDGLQKAIDNAKSEGDGLRRRFYLGIHRLWMGTAGKEIMKLQMIF